MPADTVKHTPGPWVYREIAPYDDGIGYISADGHDIVHAGVSDLPADVNRANGHLQAAAPDLLDACDFALTILEALGNGSGDAANACRAAIAKAEGRS